MKQAMTIPKADHATAKKVKNVERSKLAGKQGRLHVPRQDLNNLTTARFKSTRKGKRAGGDSEGGDGGGGEPSPKKKQKRSGYD